MNERTWSHMILTITASFGFYLIINKPYGFIWDRIGGVFLVLFILWATKTNFENAVKNSLEEKTDVKQ